MKLSATTINVLKNFSTINPSIVVKPGNVLATISPSKTLMAKATIPDEFPVTMGIYALNRFISCLSLFNEPEIDFGQTSARIFDGSRSINYHYSDASIIQTPPEKEIKFPSSVVECHLSNANLANVSKALGVLDLPEIAITGDGSKIMLQAINSKSESVDTFSVDIGETDSTFRAIFRSENLKMLPLNYDVKISKGISQWIGEDIVYYVAVEANSSF